MQQAWLLVIRKDLQLYTSLQQSIQAAAHSARGAKEYLEPRSKENTEGEEVNIDTPTDRLAASLGSLDNSIRVLGEAPTSQSALGELQSCKLQSLLWVWLPAHNLHAPQPLTASQSILQQHPTTCSSLQAI